MLKLFTHEAVVFVVLMVVVGSVVTFELDARWGMIGVALILGFSGLGHIITAQSENHGRAWNRALGVSLMLFSLFTIIVMMLMLITGEQLSTTPT